MINKDAIPTVRYAACSAAGVMQIDNTKFGSNRTSCKSEAIRQAHKHGRHVATLNNHGSGWQVGLIERI